MTPPDSLTPALDSCMASLHSLTPAPDSCMASLHSCIATLHSCMATPDREMPAPDHSAAAPDPFPGHRGGFLTRFREKYKCAAPPLPRLKRAVRRCRRGVPPERRNQLCPYPYPSASAITRTSAATPSACRRSRSSTASMRSVKRPASTRWRIRPFTVSSAMTTDKPGC